MPKKLPPAWTVVQHSGYGYGGDPLWRGGIEVRELTGHDEPDGSRRTARQERRLVEKLGGMLFTSYQEAVAFEDKVNLDGDGMYPHAPGKFAKDKIDGLAIYIPVREVVG